MYKAFEMLLNDGDTLLIENPTYTGCLSFLRTLNCNLAQVETDAEGIVPDSLESVLANWPDEKTRPRCLYTIPSGGNPTGVTATLERKRAVYEICHKYDVLILEDDAYYYLQFDKKPYTFLPCIGC